MIAVCLLNSGYVHPYLIYVRACGNVESLVVGISESDIGYKFGSSNRA